MSDHDSTASISRVYFIQSGESGPIKIGTTMEHPLKRLRTLQCGSPVILRLIGVIDRPKREHKERALHRRFKALRCSGEWFRSDPELTDFIETNAEPSFFLTTPERRRKQSHQLLLGYPNDPVLPRKPGRPVQVTPTEQWNHIRCLLYRVHENLSVAEVAVRMGISQPTVKRWTQRALSYYWYPEIKEIRKAIKGRLDLD